MPAEEINVATTISLASNENSMLHRDSLGISITLLFKMENSNRQNMIKVKRKEMCQMESKKEEKYFFLMENAQ